jgi:DNA-binding CsgD family transcriptional regulator
MGYRQGLIICPTETMAEFVRSRIEDPGASTRYVVGGTFGSPGLLTSHDWDLVLVGEISWPDVAPILGAHQPGHLVLLAPHASDLARHLLESGRIDMALDLRLGFGRGRRMIRALLNNEDPDPSENIPLSKKAFAATKDRVDEEILRLLLVGASDKEISSIVHLSHQSVRNRVHRLIARSGAANRTHLAVSYAMHCMSNSDDSDSFSGGAFEAAVGLTTSEVVRCPWTQ